MDLDEAITLVLQRVHARFAASDDLAAKLLLWKNQAFAELDATSEPQTRAGAWSVATLDVHQNLPPQANQNLHDAWLVADLLTRTLLAFRGAGLSSAQEASLVTIFDTIWSAA